MLPGITLNGEFGLPDRSSSVSNITDYVKYIIKKIKHLLIIQQIKSMLIKLKVGLLKAQKKDNKR